MTPARSVLLHLLLRVSTWFFGLGGTLLFLVGTASLGDGDRVAGLLPPGVAILAGAVAFVVWFVLYLVSNDAVKAKQRRRRR